MNIIDIISVAIFICVAFLCYRGEKAYDLKMQILEMYYHYCIKRVKDGTINDRADLYIIDQKYNKRYSYFSMVFSLKPLKLESWFSKEDINELNK